MRCEGLSLQRGTIDAAAGRTRCVNQDSIWGSDRRPASCSICIPVLRVFLFRCGAASFSLRQSFQQGINPIIIRYRLMLHMGLRCLTHHVTTGQLPEYMRLFAIFLPPSPERRAGLQVPKERGRRYGEVYSLSTSPDFSDKGGFASMMRGSPNFAAVQRNRLPHAPQVAYGGH